MRREVWEAIYEVASEEAAKEGITLPSFDDPEEAVKSLGSYGFDSLSLVEVVMIAEEKGALTSEEGDEVIDLLVQT